MFFGTVCSSFKELCTDSSQIEDELDESAINNGILEWETKTNTTLSEQFQNLIKQMVETEATSIHSLANLSNSRISAGTPITSGGVKIVLQTQYKS